MEQTKTSDRSDWIRSVVEQYEGRLVRYALRFTRDLEQSRDVVQDVFVKLCERSESIVENNVAAWLFTVCRNRCIDLQRKESRMASLSEEQLELQTSPDPTPSETLLQEEKTSVLLKALSALPENQQEVIRLKFQEGLSYREIGKVTDRSTGNVGFLIHQGITALREVMRSDFGPSLQQRRGETQ